MSPGIYYVGGCVDPSSAQAEGNPSGTGETNNCATAASTLTVIRDVDLVMTEVSTSATSVGAGHSFTINNTELNKGTTTTTASNTIKFYLSSDSLITTSDIVMTGTRPVASLAPGASTAATTTVTVPKTVVPGNYYVAACADATNAQIETNSDNTAEANNCRAAVATLTIIRDVDLIMTAVSTTVTAVGAGHTLSITNTEMNQGTTMTTASNTIKFYLSVDNLITPTDVVLMGIRIVPSLLPQASITVNTTATVPKTTTPGTYYIGACADATNTQAETNAINTAESNNCQPGGTVTVIRDVDLVMSAVSTTATSVARGTSFPISNTETNQGTTMTTVSNTLKFYLSTDVTITSTDIPLTASRTVASLGVGASSTATTNVMVPTTVAAGTYYIGVIADANNAQIENNEINNSNSPSMVSITVY